MNTLSLANDKYNEFKNRFNIFFELVQPVLSQCVDQNSPVYNHPDYTFIREQLNSILLTPCSPRRINAILEKFFNISTTENPQLTAVINAKNDLKIAYIQFTNIFYDFLTNDAKIKATKWYDLLKWGHSMQWDSLTGQAYLEYQSQLEYLGYCNQSYTIENILTDAISKIRIVLSQSNIAQLTNINQTDLLNATQNQFFTILNDYLDNKEPFTIAKEILYKSQEHPPETFFYRIPPQPSFQLTQADFTSLNDRLAKLVTSFSDLIKIILSNGRTKSDTLTIEQYCHTIINFSEKEEWSQQNSIYDTQPSITSPFALACLKYLLYFHVVYKNYVRIIEQETIIQHADFVIQSYQKLEKWATQKNYPDMSSYANFLITLAEVDKDRALASLPYLYQKTCSENNIALAKKVLLNTLALISTFSYQNTPNNTANIINEIHFKCLIQWTSQLKNIITSHHLINIIDHTCFSLINSKNDSQENNCSDSETDIHNIFSNKSSVSVTRSSSPNLERLTTESINETINESPYNTHAIEKTNNNLDDDFLELGSVSSNFHSVSSRDRSDDKEDRTPVNNTTDNAIRNLTSPYLTTPLLDQSFYKNSFTPVSTTSIQRKETQCS